MTHFREDDHDCSALKLMLTLIPILELRQTKGSMSFGEHSKLRLVKTTEDCSLSFPRPEFHSTVVREREEKHTQLSSVDRPVGRK